MVLCALMLPAFVQAVTVTNTVNVHAHTGGQSGQDGADGKAGADGRNGEDGRPGTDGQSVISGSGSASVDIEAIVNGKKVIDIHRSETAEGNQSAAIVVEETYTTSLATTSTVVSAEATTTHPSLSQIFLSIHLILLEYVHALF